MNDTTPDRISDQLQGSLDDVKDALHRGLDTDVSVAVGEHRPLDATTIPEDWQKAGLVLGWGILGKGMLLLVPESSGLVPKPEPNGSWSDTVTNRLQSLAQELSFLAVPGDSFGKMGHAVFSDTLVGKLQETEPSETAFYLSLALTSGDTSSVAYLVWTVEKLSALTHSDESDAQPSPQTDSANSNHGDPSGHSPSGQSDHAPSSEETVTRSAVDPSAQNLPPYGKSLLRVNVPLVVTLAIKKEKVADILNIVPGSIIQFEKPCDEMLDLAVNNQKIAVGEAVKVDEKFGLRICEITKPDERFYSIAPDGASATSSGSSSRCE